MNKALDEIIKTIVNSSDYKKCLELKEKMKDNEEIIKLIEKIKSQQKEYVKTRNSAIKNNLDELEKELRGIPIYYEYNKSLEKVNEMISLVRDELNLYFDNLLNDCE